MFVLATAVADAAIRGKKLITFDFDIEGFFINGNPLPRSHTGGRQIITRLPSNLPAPWANQLAEVLQAHYGLKQANHVADQNLIAYLLANGFTRCPSSPYTFNITSPTDPADKLTVSMHVDDGDGNTTCPLLYANFKRLIEARYGPTTFHSPSRGTCGQDMVTHPCGSVAAHYGTYIRRMLNRIGMDAVPAALSPDIAGFFDAPSDPTPLTPSAHAAFRTTMGELIYIIPGRHDCRKNIVFLLSSVDKPTASDDAKLFHLLRYLKGSTDLGPTFSSDPAAYGPHVSIHSASDYSHNVHTDGKGHQAFALTVGKVGAPSAPFLFHSAKEPGPSLSPCEGEYVTLSKTAQQLVHYRQFAADLGYTDQLSQPSIMLEDNDSARKLTTAPLIPSKSRHIALKEHHIRHLHAIKAITVIHQGSHDIVPDAATKHVGPSRFLYFRSQVFQGPRILNYPPTNSKLAAAVPFPPKTHNASPSPSTGISA